MLGAKLVVVLAVAMLVVGCASDGDEIESLDATLQAYMTESAVGRANAANQVDQLQEAVTGLEAAVLRIEESLENQAESAEPTDTRDIWIPPTDITEDMDPLEAAARCLTAKMFASPIAESLGDQILEGFLGDFGFSDEDQMAEQMGPFMRYLFCGF